jgi:hypothetical protein
MLEAKAQTLGVHAHVRESAWGNGTEPGGATPHGLLFLDGRLYRKFSGSVEISIDLSALHVGTHSVAVEAVDAEGLSFERRLLAAPRFYPSRPKCHARAARVCPLLFVSVVPKSLCGWPHTCHESGCTGAGSICAGRSASPADVFYFQIQHAQAQPVHSNRTADRSRGAQPRRTSRLNR